MSTKRLGLILASALFLFPVSVLAHGSGSHVMGTLTASDEGQMRVKKSDGSELAILLNKATRYQGANGAPTDERPQVGDRVVVDLAGGWTGVLATNVRFSPAVPREAHSHTHGETAHN